MRQGMLLLLALVLVLPGQPNPPHPKLQSTLWVQTSALWPSLCRQAYRSAEMQLDEALADNSWSAMMEQASMRGLRTMPPALIVDVDETVLDNSPFQARLIKTGGSFTAAAWAEWADEANALPIPGALPFLQKAAMRGVRVFYVTNRPHELEDSTRRNLARWGFPLASDEDCILTLGETPEWGSDKTTRRRHVAANYRVIFLFGDDLGDFIPQPRRSVADRRHMVDEMQGFFGTRWFALPNPVYGSWERALVGNRRVNAEEREKLRLRALDERR
ncbi:MAG TPA: 5'-nucleotidase, lipoprotein e(P4) family [Planctomycetes bacterium]|nr:5'-nucleotidase, lipoprotein e(P4) family [Planctomycetota bacterium]